MDCGVYAIANGLDILRGNLPGGKLDGLANRYEFATRVCQARWQSVMRLDRSQISRR